MLSTSVLGVDVGTTYTKLCSFDASGSPITHTMGNSVQFNIEKGVDENYAGDTWRSLVVMLRQVASITRMKGFSIRTIAVSGISPVLIAFSKHDADVALSIPYWAVPTIDHHQTGNNRTRRRIAHLSKAMHDGASEDFYICDLIGYLNFRLSGRLTINSITVEELDIGADYNELLSDVNCLSPAECCAAIQDAALIGAEAICCAGAPDSFCAALGVGADAKGAQMIYLGTFGSLLEVKYDLLDACFSRPIAMPYVWVFSVPRFGPTIEQFAQQLSNLTGEKALRWLDETAEAVPPGSMGVIFHVPRLRPDGKVVGGYGFTSCLDTEAPVLAKARAMLEALPYALLASSELHLFNAKAIFLSGGGASSRIWKQVIADCLNKTIISALELSPSMGAGRLAIACYSGRAAAYDFAAKSSSILKPSIQAHELASKSACLAEKWYKRNHRY